MNSRQGEVLFMKLNMDRCNYKKNSDTKITKLQLGLHKKEFSLKASGNICEGEVTGHIHKAVGECELYEDKNGTMFLRVTGDSEIKHEEHESLKLDKGDYEIVIQREYDEEQNRYVAD